MEAFARTVGPEPVTVLNCETLQGRQELARVLENGRFDTVQMEGVHLMVTCLFCARRPTARG
jgi:hypothetical protein